MFSLLPFRILCFPCYVEVSLHFKLERILKKNNSHRFFFKAYCVGWTNETYS